MRAALAQLEELGADAVFGSVRQAAAPGTAPGTHGEATSTVEGAAPGETAEGGGGVAEVMEEDEVEEVAMEEEGEAAAEEAAPAEAEAEATQSASESAAGETGETTSEATVETTSETTVEATVAETEEAVPEAVPEAETEVVPEAETEVVPEAETEVAVEASSGEGSASEEPRVPETAPERASATEALADQAAARLDALLQNIEVLKAAAEDVNAPSQAAEAANPDPATPSVSSAERAEVTAAMETAPSAVEEQAEAAAEPADESEERPAAADELAPPSEGVHA